MKKSPVTQKIQLLGMAIVLAMLGAAAWTLWSDLQIPSLAANAGDSAAFASSTSLAAKPPMITTPVHGFRPAYILQIHETPLPELQAWATDWHSETSVDLPHLADLISKSDLSATECLQIGVMIGNDEGYPISKVWISAGYQRAHDQLSGRREGRESLKPLIVALASAQDSLQGKVDAAWLLEQLNTLIIGFGHSSDWDQTPEWARVHRADALLLEGRNIDAKKEADAMIRESQTNKRWEPKLKRELNLMAARIPFEPEASSPMDVLQAHRVPPQPLIIWMANWQNSHLKDQSDDSETMVELKGLNLLNLIEKSDLSALECLRIGDLMADAGDFLNAEAFAAVGTDRAEFELKDVANGDMSARPILNELKRSDDRLWESPGSPNTRGITLEKITSILMRFDREDPWDQTPEWARIGHGEALYMQQRYSKSLAEANQLATDATTDANFTNEQKSGIEWLQAMVLFDTQHYRDAIPHLESTATHTAFPHSKEAWPLWAVALAKSGNPNHANEVFDDWIRRDRPAVDDAARVLDLIQNQEAH
jgi:hypothetical protein